MGHQTNMLINKTGFMKVSQSEYDPMISNYFTFYLLNKKRSHTFIYNQIEILKNKHVKKEIKNSKIVDFKCVQIHPLNQSQTVAQKMLEKLGWRPGSRLGRNNKK